MRTALAIAIVLAIGAAGQEASSAASGSAATRYALSANMTAGQVVTPANRPWRPPANVRDARGRFTGTLTIGGGARRLQWRITYRDIGRSTLEIADIHLGKPGRFGQILVRLCGPCESGQSGNKRISTGAATAIKSGNAWITVITSTYPNGVIRGQIRVR